MTPDRVSHATVHDRRAYDDAAELMSGYGEHAALEAAMRAERSRDLGNHIHFCRWRQVERLIAALALTDSEGSIH